MIATEYKAEIIKWLNLQTYFTPAKFFTHFQVNSLEKQGRALYQIIATAIQQGYIQRIKRGEYHLTKKLPDDFKITRIMKAESFLIGN